MTVKDPSGASGSKQLTIQVAAGVAPVGTPGATPVAAVFRSVGAPTLEAFAQRGLKARLSCPAGSTGRATLVAGRRAARALGLRGRRLAAAAVRCGDGGASTVRLTAGRAVRRKLRRAEPAAIQATVKVRFAGQAEVSRRVTLRARG